MAYNMPSARDTYSFVDPAILLDAPLLLTPNSTSASTLFDLDELEFIGEDIPLSFDLEPMLADSGGDSGCGSIPRLDFLDTFNADTGFPHQSTPCPSSPSTYLYALDDFFASIMGDTSSSVSNVEPLQSSSSSVGTVDFSVDKTAPMSGEEQEPNFVIPPLARSVDFSTPIPRAPKRKTEGMTSDSDDTSSSCSEYAPRKRPSTSKRPSRTSVPAHLQPIKVQSVHGRPRCPMPNCGVELEDRDSVWRGHFRKVHHDDLCLTPGCRRERSSGMCKAKCPFPLPGCKACGEGHGHAGSASSKGGKTGEMTVESVGRHLLNVHFKVSYRCPVCGLENEWRESACVRHMKRCVEKKGKERIGRAPY